MKAAWLGRLFRERVTDSSWEALPSSDAASSTSPSLASKSDLEVVRGQDPAGAPRRLGSLRQAAVPLSKLNTLACVLALPALGVRRVARCFPLVRFLLVSALAAAFCVDEEEEAALCLAFRALMQSSGEWQEWEVVDELSVLRWWVECRLEAQLSSL